MSYSSNLNSFSALIVMLGVFFCAYAFTRYSLRVTPRILIPGYVIFSFASVLAVPFIHSNTALSDNRALLVFFILYYPIFMFSVELSWARSLTVYLWAVVLLLFPSNISCLIEADRHRDHISMSFGPDALLMQLVLSVGICGAVWYFSLHVDKRVLSHVFTPESLWVAWLSVPILFLGLNIALLPRDYRILHPYSLFGTYLFFSASLFVLYAYLTSIFYSQMLEYIRITEYKEAQKLSAIQSIQYKNLLSKIASERHARHDFKHTLHLMGQLASSGDMKGIKDYIRQYTRESFGTIIKNYCSNPAINAVLNYYEGRAANEGVVANLQVDLPVALPMSDPEFCSLLGNIMENAIDAAKDSSSDIRKFSISIRVQNESMLYIVSSNSYDGELIQEATGEKYLFSVKNEKNHGIGLQSIRETVDKYSGTLRISGDGKEFFLDIAISL